MNPDEVSPVLDVHPPHEPVHGWRDFLLHILTITIGLLIALSLEGALEWQHHRHLVHEAEAALHAEIADNAKDMQDALDDVQKQQEVLKRDVVVLQYILKNHRKPEDSKLSISFHVRGFSDLSWRTAQTTGAFSYMSYERAQAYSDIYNIQDDVQAAQKQAARDAIVSLGGLMNSEDGAYSIEGVAGETIGKIEVLQGQLLLLGSFEATLNASYKKFLSGHTD